MTKNKLILGLTHTNFGGTLKYINDSVDLGSATDLGCAINNLFLKNLTYAVDVRALSNGSTYSLNTGLEYLWHINPEWSLAPRMGFKSYDTQVSYGIGFGWTLYTIDYAYVPHIDLGQSHRISFTAKF